MTDLIACLGAGKGTWSYMKRLIEEESWNKVFLVTNSFGKENFKIEKAEKEIKFVVIDDKKPLPDLVKEIRNQLEGKISETEVALNLVSGTGKIHMAMLSALLKLGLGIRLIALTYDGIKEI